MKQNEAVNVTRSSMPDFEEYCDEIKELWDSHWLTNMGTKHKQLEADLKKYLHTDNITLYVNGHLALENIIAAMGFKNGGEVITTPFTFASTTHAISRNGLVPIFCDVRDDNYTIDASKIEALITDKTVAIIPVHVYGNICDTEKIQLIADKYKLKVIYDAAHAFGVTYNGISSANMGDASMFSFHATKVFNTIEGGAVCYRDKSLSSMLNDMKNFGIHGAETCVYAGGNAKMNEFQAAMGICNLRHLNSEIEKRKEAADIYRARLSGIDGIKLCTENPAVKSNYAYFPAVFDGKFSRDRICEKLAEENIIARKYFYPLTSNFSCYLALPTAGEEKTPIAEYISARVLCLPIFADISRTTVKKICDIITEKC